MITLPNECYCIVFNNLRHNYKNLFSCALVNRQWCRIIIPILWSEPGHNFKDKRLIRTILLTLNAEEQALLIPFNICLPSHPKPLFEYASYITSVTNDLCYGIGSWLPYGDNKNWLSCERLYIRRNLENIIKCSLIAMFLRASKNLKYLYLDEIICNQVIFENLYKNTTVTSVDLYLTYSISDDFKSKAIDGLE
ncbi:f-box domain-containing protein [Gigaspora margarita]|uniref:F-box domain-containing protein n=1 Tax=Gigaspora margarita TaxID=4874 RepID=A0A8H3XA64_GIGMA|nr:f-box domain-containing protein [Gigaspora margarita]